MAHDNDITVSCDHFDHHADLFPIPRGPYAGHDYLYVEHHPCGGYEVKRKTTTGELVEDFGKVKTYDEALAIVRFQRTEQSRKDCNAVTGGGRWSCD